MSAPLVSILIPCYNAERWVAQTLESALAQTWPHREIILVDDGSRDGSLAIARTFAARGVQVIAQANRGASAARNTAWRAARGDFLQFLDADDLLAPDKIEQQLSRLAPDEDDVLLSGAWGRFFDEPASARFESGPLARDLTPTAFLTLALQTHGMMHPAAWLTSRRLASAAGPWDETLSLNDDGEYFARVALAARTIRYCPAARSYYRSGLRRSLSRSRSERAWDSQLRATEMTSGYLLARDSAPSARQAAADALQRDLLDAYPFARHLRRRLEARVSELGGSALRYDAGPRYKLLARLLGWKLAKRLRNRLA